MSIDAMLSAAAGRWMTRALNLRQSATEARAAAAQQPAVAEYEGPAPDRRRALDEEWEMLRREVEALPAYARGSLHHPSVRRLNELTAQLAELDKINARGRSIGVELGRPYLAEAERAEAEAARLEEMVGYARQGVYLFDATRPPDAADAAVQAEAAKQGRLYVRPVQRATAVNRFAAAGAETADSLGTQA